MSDCISRQVAIDAIRELLLPDEEGYEGVMYRNQTVCNCVRTLYGLPSVTPTEIIRCKDCKWFNQIGCSIKIIDETDKPTEDDFCSFAERTGHWIKDDSEDIAPIWGKIRVCSNCAYLQFNETNYCPNCGARMESEES